MIPFEAIKQQSEKHMSKSKWEWFGLALNPRKKNILLNKDWIFQHKKNISKNMLWDHTVDGKNPAPLMMPENVLILG